MLDVDWFIMHKLRQICILFMDKTYTSDLGQKCLVLLYSGTGVIFFNLNQITYGSCTRTHTQCSQILRVRYEYI